MNPEILKTVTDVIDRNLNVKVVPESNLRTDVDMDSLELVEFGICLEKELGITIPDSDLALYHDMTVGQIVDALQELLP